ncbi:hypothetical protein DFH06DRAFT_1472821 [Mycena polygramma]|nr:hypothetical protein DFH06DRAFT_1472821 [Mycena polygramma]
MGESPGSSSAAGEFYRCHVLLHRAVSSCGAVSPPVSYRRPSRRLPASLSAVLLIYSRIGAYTTPHPACTNHRGPRSTRSSDVAPSYIWQGAQRLRPVGSRPFAPRAAILSANSTHPSVLVHASASPTPTRPAVRCGAGHYRDLPHLWLPHRPWKCVGLRWIWSSAATCGHRRPVRPRLHRAAGYVFKAHQILAPPPCSRSPCTSPTTFDTREALPSSARLHPLCTASMLYITFPPSATSRLPHACRFHANGARPCPSPYGDTSPARLVLADAPHPASVSRIPASPPRVFFIDTPRTLPHIVASTSRVFSPKRTPPQSARSLASRSECSLLEVGGCVCVWPLDRDARVRCFSRNVDPYARRSLAQDISKSNGDEDEMNGFRPAKKRRRRMRTYVRLHTRLVPARPPPSGQHLGLGTRNLSPADEGMMPVCEWTNERTTPVSRFGSILSRRRYSQAIPSPSPSPFLPFPSSIPSPLFPFVPIPLPSSFRPPPPFILPLVPHPSSLPSPPPSCLSSDTFILPFLPSSPPLLPHPYAPSVPIPLPSSLRPPPPFILPLLPRPSAPSSFLPPLPRLFSRIAACA